MPAIFISHSSRDKKIADDITTAIKHLGFEEVFLDFDTDTGIGAGANWEKTLYEKLSRCHALILLLTPNWLDSTWCRIELAQARAQGKVILPIVCAPIGDRFVLPEIQAVDLVDWNSGGIERLEQNLRAIANDLARGFKLDPNRPPYPGIHAFEAEDAAIYFGRDDETRAVIEKLDARRTQGGQRLLVVIGASGSGKSSLLKAGVLPQLGRRRKEWLVLPSIRPEKAPVETLAKAITQHLGKPDQWRALYQTLNSTSAIDHIAELLKDLRTGDARAATVLLPIDQFEEIFTVAEPTERATFLNLLASALDPACDLPLMVVATGRSDVLEGLIETGALAHFTETYPLPPMPLDRVPRLIEGPAAVAGLNVDKGLSEAIVRDVESSEALPLLAHTLALLYWRGIKEKKLTLADYVSLGDPTRGLNPIQNSVRLVADEAVTGLKPSQQELDALRDAFVPHLVRVRLDDGKRVRQPAHLSDLPRESHRFISKLVEARLLTIRSADNSSVQVVDSKDALIEVSHEALFKSWLTLDQWLNEEQAFLSDLERIKTAHEIWTQAREDQKGKALLGGLLLSRARDWLTKYPQRFVSRNMAELHRFIRTSAEAEDAEKARIAAQQERTRRIERRMLHGAIAASVVLLIVAAVAAWQWQEAATQRNRAKNSLQIATGTANVLVTDLARKLRDRVGMPIDLVREILDRAQELQETLLASGETAPELRFSAANALNELLLTLRDQGAVSVQADVAATLKMAERYNAIMAELVAKDPLNSEWQYHLSLSHNRVGDVLDVAGRYGEALENFNTSLAIRLKLAAVDPTNPERQEYIATSYNKIGDELRKLGRLKDALDAYERSLTIRQAIATGAETDPQWPQWQRNLAASYERKGIALDTLKQGEPALAAFTKTLEIRQVLVATADSALYLRELSISYESVGNMLAKSGKYGQALAAYKEGRIIRESLLALDTANKTRQRDLAVILRRVGEMMLKLDQRAEALDALKASLTIRERLARDDPSNVLWQTDLVGTLREMARAGDEPRSCLTRALEITRRLKAEGKLGAEQVGWIEVLEQELNALPP